MFESSCIHDFTKEVTVIVPVIIAKTIFEETYYKVLLIFVTVMVPVIIAKTIFEETHYKVLLIFVTVMVPVSLLRQFVRRHITKYF